MKNLFAMLTMFFSLMGVRVGAQEIIYPATEAPISSQAVAPEQPIQFQVPLGSIGNGQLRQQLGGRLGQRRAGRLGQRIQERMGGQGGGRLIDGPVDLNQPRAQLLMQGLDYLLGPGVNIGANAEGSAIDVTIHPQAIEAAADGFRNNVVAPVQGIVPAAGPAEYGLTIYPETANSPKRLVVAVHGFNSGPDRFHHVIQSLRASEFRVATYSYATEEGVVAAAQSLSKHLNGWASRNPEYEISLLAHSMGGIVARYVVESPSLHCTAIDQLIMIAPPNHGSELARIGMTDQPFGNQTTGEVDRPQLLRLISQIAKRMNPAIGDMRPDSKVLSVLNDYPRNKAIAYSILLGNKAPLTKKQAVILAEAITELGAERPMIELAGQQAADTLEQVSQEVVGKGGDGVVSVTSGRLAGVDDIEVLSFQHNDLLNAQSDGWQLLKPEILKRLAAPVESPMVELAPQSKKEGEPADELSDIPTEESADDSNEETADESTSATSTKGWSDTTDEKDGNKEDPSSAAKDSNKNLERP